MQVGMTKDQGLYNKTSAAVHQGPLAAKTLPQYNTITFIYINYEMENSNSSAGFDVHLHCIFFSILFSQ